MALPGQVSPPDITLSSAAPSRVDGADVVAVPVFRADGEASGLLLGPGAAELLDDIDLDAFALLEHFEATAKAGELVEHPVLTAEGSDPSDIGHRPGFGLVLFVGMGDASAVDLRRAGAALARRTKGKARLATSLGALCDDAGLRALVEGLVLGSFGFHRRSSGPQQQPVADVVLAGVTDADARTPVLAHGFAVACAAWDSREMSLTPSNEKSPAWMVDRAQAIATTTGLDIKVWDENQLVDQGFGGLVGVGRASATPPRLIRLDYTPKKTSRKTRHVVLVGKGITFDTGGLSIKPAEAMMNMKRDMTGGGVVLAVMAALGQIGCEVKVTGLVPCAENAVGGNALRPGDVVRHYGGRTSEVTNTDAEGRLVLADAMAYAVAEVQPDVLVDVATLTGAIKVALGQRTGGLFSNNDALADLLRTCGESAGEPLWRMPLADDYEERLESKVADADNAAGGPGAITAALFLQHFVGSLPWAHLDIASVGDAPTDSAEWTVGATGFGARALLHWLELADPLEGVA